MQIRILFLFIIFIVSLCSGCIVKDAPEPEITKEELLAGEKSKSWRPTTLILDGIDITEDMHPCSDDDLWIFYRTTQRMLMSDEDILCDSGVFFSYRWDINEENNTLKLTSAPSYIEQNILKLTKKEMILITSRTETHFVAIE